MEIHNNCSLLKRNIFVINPIYWPRMFSNHVSYSVSLSAISLPVNLGNWNKFQYLATKVCSLGLYVVRQRKISRAGETFLRGCIAYVFITTASLSSCVTKIGVYIQVGMLSLTSHSLSQVSLFQWEFKYHSFLMENY